MYQLQYKPYGTGEFGENGWKTWGEFRSPCSKPAIAERKELDGTYLLRWVDKKLSPEQVKP